MLAGMMGHAKNSIVAISSFLLLFLLVFSAWPAQAARSTGNPTYLIGLRAAGSGPTAQSLSGVKRAVVRELLREGGQIKVVYSRLAMIAARLSPEAALRLAQDPRVRYLVPDGPIAAPERFSLQPIAGSPVEFYPWGVERVHAPEVQRAQPVVQQAGQAGWVVLLMLFITGLGWLLTRRRRYFDRAWLGLGLIVMLLALPGCSWVALWPHPAGISGQGVNVALLDTGIDTSHPDLSANYQGGYDFVNNDPDPQDDNGHGTAVAGVLAAAENGIGIIGVAPRARLWELKILDANEEGSISNLLRGLDWAIAHHVQIVNMSLGTPDDNQALREGIEATARAGILMIAAAGNKGESVFFPAAYPQVIAVAASDRANHIAWFSNQGPEVELTAPGTKIISTALHGKYGVVNGTSFAAPHVAGVAALLFSAGLSDPQAVRRLLDSSADDLGLARQAQGYGLVDAERAYQLLMRGQARRP